MYGKGKLLGISNVATGLALLPNTGSNRLLFVAAAVLLVFGAVVFTLSIVSARGSNATK